MGLSCADSLEELNNSQGGNFIARIAEDMSVEVFPLPQVTNIWRFLVGSNDRFYLLGSSGDELYLWDLDVRNDFKMGNVYRLVDTEGKLANYVMHTLRPQRFGGEDDGDIIHLLNTTVSEDPNNEKLYHAWFRLPEASEYIR